MKRLHLLALLATTLLAIAEASVAVDPMPKGAPSAPTRKAAKPTPKAAVPVPDVAAPAPVAAPAEPFRYDNVVSLARALASKPFQAPEVKLPRALADASYDDNRKLRFRRERGPWYGKIGRAHV